jgi:hypothetical protein
MEWYGPEIKKMHDGGAEPWIDPGFTQKFVLQMPAREIGKDSFDEPIYRNIPARSLDREKKTVFTAGPMKEGDRIIMCKTNANDLSKRTAKVARTLLKSSGFSSSGLRGALALMCSTNAFCGAEGGMQQCAEQMAEAHGYAPCLGMCGGGEIGQHGDGASGCGYGMYSCVFFTSRLVDDVLTPGRTKVLKNSTTMHMTTRGTFMEVEE